MKKILLVLLLLFSAISFSQTWTAYLTGNHCSSFCVDKQNRFLAGGYNIEVDNASKIWKYNGIGWDTIYRGPRADILSIAVDTLGQFGNIYAVGDYLGMVKSTNGGLNWTLINFPLFLGGTLQRVVCSKNGIIHVTTTTGYLRSTNGGVSFDTALKGNMRGKKCIPIILDNSNENIIYVGVINDNSPISGFYRSTDAGITFSENLSPFINCNSLYQNTDGNIYRTTSTSLFSFDKSTDQGLTWVTLSNIPHYKESIVFIGSDIYISGYFINKSTDGGLTWSYFQPASVYNGQMIFYQNRLFISGGGSAGGARAYDIVAGVISNQNTISADNFTLYQNYPNPFNPSTTIVYELKKAESISLKIYDGIGNEIKEIDNGFKNAGRYEVNFSGENLSSGIYYARLTVGENTITKNLLLIK